MGRNGTSDAAIAHYRAGLLASGVGLALAFPMLGGLGEAVCATGGCGRDRSPARSAWARSNTCRARSAPARAWLNAFVGFSRAAVFHA